MIYVHNGVVKSISDMDVVNDPEKIAHFQTVVEFRERGSQTLHARRFDHALDAEAFVNENRGVALMKDGAAVTGKYVKLGNWDWFGIRPKWVEKSS